MPFQHQIQGAVGAIMGVGAEASSPGHVVVRPVPYGGLGHYRVTHRCLLATAQAANSRLFEVRNTHATNLIIPTRLVLKLFQTAAGTAQIAGLDIFKCTGFTVVDTTNTVTPTVSQKRASMASAPGGLAVRGVTIAGAAAGMTGGTLTKDGGAFNQLTYAVAAAAGTNVQSQWGPYDVLDDVNGTHPFVFVQNEGFEIENRTLNTTSFGVELVVDFSWAEVPAGAI